MNSIEPRTFTIRNEIRQAIQGKLEIHDEQLSEHSYQQPWVIPPSTTGAFDVVFSSSKLGAFKSTVNYWINEKHKFQFQVSATVVEVKLSLTKKYVDFMFSEDNHKMHTTEVLNITNHGNATA